MPNLDEGTLLYMPTTLPGISVTKAAELMQTQDRIIRLVPRGRLGLWQGRPGGNRDRPCALRRCSRPSSISSRRTEWRPGVTIDSLIAGDGQGAAVSGRLQRLDHADQGAHRHALDRHPHPRRRQGDRH